MALTSLPKARLSIQRPPVLLSATELVEIRPAGNPGGLPVVIRPLAAGVDAAAWVRGQRDRIAQLLHHHGGVLLRGFGLRDAGDFQRLLDAAGIELMHYIEKATPRRQVSEHVYTSTVFPAEYAIALHNELSYVRQWPGRIAFFCEEPPDSAGETPLADVRRVLSRIAPAIRERFRRLGWMLVRNFGSGIGPSWQHSLAVASRAEAEDYLRRSDTQWEWLDGDAPGSRLRTFQRRAAVRRHPVTQEELWFNHVAFWHPSSVSEEVRRGLQADLGQDLLPYNTLYGDGSEIPQEVAAHLRAAYDAETVKFPWERGDFLLLDNMLVAHGRSPYRGPRRILTAMGDEVRPDSVLPQ